MSSEVLRVAMQTALRARTRMVERIREQGVRDERVLAAMMAVPRHLFVEEALASRAYEDTALLAGVSLMSWYYIFMKLFAVKQAREKTENFERDFWSGGDLNNLFNSAVNDRHHAGSMERIFEAGFREFTKLRGQKNLDPKDIVDS